MGQVLETDPFQKGHLLQLKTCCFSGVSLFDMTMAFLAESKQGLQKKHTLSKVMYLTKCPLCAYMYLLLAFAFYADCSTMYNPCTIS